MPQADLLSVPACRLRVLGLVATPAPSSPAERRPKSVGRHEGAGSQAWCGQKDGRSLRSRLAPCTCTDSVTAATSLAWACTCACMQRRPAPQLPHGSLCCPSACCMATAYQLACEHVILICSLVSHSCRKSIMTCRAAWCRAWSGTSTSKPQCKGGRCYRANAGTLGW